ncbi:5'/3'-nucleotidase SurE [Thaumasiovibrio subtropicus]|uniref:5'/3'-nucleotidase SurE n=1 Tax=Thaumasiovibrio subtropicus TaxID=1891207 RepID=UPI000B34EB46|nr:5'/3'-nucleotidase SurE [Thaumasiovibrio subtropicus]
MRILISNDDGVWAEGINVLAEVLSDIGDIYIVAPDRNRSGASNSLTLDTPLRLHTHQEKRVSVQGTPTDCVHLALNALLDFKPDLVIAGINHGANLGDDVLYSGTVAAATEGHFLDVPSMAISLVGKTHFDTAARVAKEVIERMMNSPVPDQRLLNINVPDCEYDALKGWQITRLGARHRAEAMIQDTDPRGHEIYWLGPPGPCQDAGPGTDFYAVEHQYVSITPLQVDLTAHNSMQAVEQWLQK